MGGLGEIGRNMMVFETTDDIVVVDAGILFPSEEMHGIDYIIPDVTYLLERRDKLRAYLITHGHEDHIGALPHLLRDLPAPVYASRLAQGLIGLKLRNNKVRGIEQVEVTPQTVAEFGSITAEFFPVAHSIPDAMGIALRTPAGLVVHTGDFKIDHTPVMSVPTDLNRMALYGEEGVRLLLSDSTYADTPGNTPSELAVGEALEHVMLTAPGRVIIATFASQIARVQQIVDGAETAGRTVFPTGRSMVQNVKMARDLNYIQSNAGVIRDINQHEKFPDEDVVIVCTGGQGEPMSALARMSMGDHRDVRIKQGDTVVMSSNPIPGNESAVYRTIDNLFRVGADVRYSQGGASNVHVRGHAAQEELKTVLGLVKPEHFIPVHGEHRHLSAHVRLAEAMGVAPERAHLLRDGAVFELTPRGGVVVDEAPASYVFVDGMSVGDVDHTVLRDRQHLANDGIVVVVVTVDHETGAVIADPDVVSRGFTGLDESPDLRKRTAEALHKMLERDRHPVETSALQEIVKDEISRFLYRETRQRPMVLPVVVEV
ncbi:MAG: ribonuclease J [Chloroflexi bacterium]|nr:MAG: ribonuclease J [Chloroflexota bacterium]